MEKALGSSLADAVFVSGPTHGLGPREPWHGSQQALGSRTTLMSLISPGALLSPSTG